MTLPEFAREYGNALACPNCGFGFLHHTRVDVYDRNEDASHGRHVAVTRGGGANDESEMASYFGPDEGAVTVDSDMDGNPSRRRTGLTIQFLCEGCPARPTLELLQHKGNTYIRWQDTGGEGE